MQMVRGLGLREIVSQVGAVLLQRLGSLILQISILVLLAHTLGPTGFGQYAVAILVPGLLQPLLSLGMPPATVYALGRGAAVRTVLLWNLRLGSGIVACGVALSVILVASASEQIFPGVPRQLLWISTCGFPAAWFYNSMTAVLRGKQDFRRYNLAMLINPAANLVGAVLLVWVAGLGASGAVAAWASGQVCGLVLASWFVWGHCLAESVAAPSDPQERPSLRYGLKLYLANILAFLNYRLDILLVNWFVGPGGAGIYAAAVRLAEQLWLLSGATQIVLLPRLAALHRAEGTRRQLTPIIARWITMAGLMMAIALALTSDWIVPLAFGVEYAETATVLLWLLPGVVAYSCVNVLSPDLLARGRPDLNGWTAGAALAINIVGNLILIPFYGVIGAALASTLAYLAAALITILFYARLSHNRAWDVMRMGRTDWDILRMAIATVRGKKP
jgi:O-antigen/teichoic acid export membrane protein